MNAYFGAFGVVFLGIILGVIYYPNPPLTPNLKKWMKKGKFLTYKDFDIFYIDEKGNNPDGGVVLCIHGFPTSSYDYSKILDGLKAKFDRVILYDMLGFGFTDKPSDHTYSIMEQADIAEVILQEVGVKQVHVLSHDYGDTVALELLARYNSHGGKDPKQIQMKSLCLTNGGVFPETNFPRPSQKLLAIPYLGALMSRLFFYRAFRRGFGEVFGPNTQPTEEDFKDFFAAICHKGSVTSRLIRYIEERSVYKERWVGALQKTKIPVHMIYGPNDPVNPVVFVEHYKKTVPNPSITVLQSDIGHYPQWEVPDEVIKYYTQFIRKIKAQN